VEAVPQSPAKRGEADIADGNRAAEVIKAEAEDSSPDADDEGSMSLSDPSIADPMPPWPLPRRPAPDLRRELSWYEELVRDAVPTLDVTLLHPHATPPLRHSADAGWYVHVSPAAALPAGLAIAAHERRDVRTGIALAVPPQHVVVVLPLPDLRLRHRVETAVTYVFPEPEPSELVVKVANRSNCRRVLTANAPVAHFVLLRTEDAVRIRVRAAPKA
jgi:dUTPase